MISVVAREGTERAEGPVYQQLQIKDSMTKSQIRLNNIYRTLMPQQLSGCI